MGRKRDIEREFETLWKQIGDGTPLVKQYPFAKHYKTENFPRGRRWKFDFAIPEHKIAIEMEGIGGKSRHTSITGYPKDCEKYNVAVILGWSVLRFTQMQLDGRTEATKTKHRHLWGAHHVVGQVRALLELKRGQHARI